MGNLTLNGATSGQITIAPPAVAGTNTLTLPASTGTVALTSSPIFTGTVTATTLTSPAATNLTIQSASTTAMTIDTSQNVGIGTGGPIAKLDVRGTIYGQPSSPLPSSGVGSFSYYTAGAYGGGIGIVDGVNAWGLWDSAGTLYIGNATSGGSAGALTGRVFIDSSGNVGIGTASPSAYGKFAVSGANQTNVLTAYSGSSGFQSYLDDSIGEVRLKAADISGGTASKFMTFYTQSSGSASAERMRIDTSGNVGIGQSSITRAFANYNQLNISGSSGSTIQMQVGSTTNANIVSDNNGLYLAGLTGYMVFSTGGTGTGIERMRINSNGALLVGTTDDQGSSGPGHKFLPNPNTPQIFTVLNTAGSANTYHLYNMSATNNGFRFYVQVNGGIANYSANNTNLSDERVKTDIQSAGNYLDKICAIPVRTFKYKDQGNDPEKTLGVIAQEVEKVAPELVNNDGFGKTPEDGMPLKTVYQTDLQYALMKCIQELKAELDALKGMK